ncbi:MAG: IS66 family insertion sequence element accessory protein TnpB [Saprospiraceae bacterium]|nr:IS66 family insertion sequence element accessory protein TnpB [Saprospiraceae bacterium]
MAFLEFGPIICIVSQQTCAKVCNGLGGVVNNEMGKDLLSGDGFIFLNKRRTLIKVLVWDRTGYVIYYKKVGFWHFGASGLERRPRDTAIGDIDLTDDVGRS